MKKFYFQYNKYPDQWFQEDWCVTSLMQIRFPSLLPLAMKVAARTLGQDLVSVQPMPGPQGILHYLDYVYDGDYPKDDPWYIWKRLRDLDAKAHAENRTLKKFYFAHANRPKFSTVIRRSGEVNQVEVQPEQIVENAENFGIDYWAELEGARQMWGNATIAELLEAQEQHGR